MHCALNRNVWTVSSRVWIKDSISPYPFGGGQDICDSELEGPETPKVRNSNRIQIAYSTLHIANWNQMHLFGVYEHFGPHRGLIHNDYINIERMCHIE